MRDIVEIAVEKERLRFEGDLDRWMKIIGAGITGYQPEAYAVMDWACEELVKARKEIALLSAQNKWLKDRLAYLQLPAKSPKNIEEWLAECGMPTTLTENSDANA